MATPGAEDILNVDSASFVVTEVADSVLEGVAVADHKEDDVGASEIVADHGELELEPSTSTSAAAVMKTIIEALAAASKNGGATEAKSCGEGEGASGSEVPVIEQPQPGESTPAQMSADETNSTAIAAAALQALASQMSSSSQLSSSEAIAQLQQVLNIPIEDIPAAATTLVNEVASEVIVMAQAAQHATMAAESLIEGLSGNEVEEEDGEDELTEEEEEDEAEAEWSSPRQTKKGKLKIHKCPECGKGYGLSTTLARHIQLHTKEKKCQHCDKIFFSPVKLSNHIRVHHTHAEKEKNSICQQCGKAFYNNAKLRVHMRSHTGDRPYKCSYCEKSFTCSSHRKRHERLHTGEHPYICQHCDKGFSSPSNLKDHIYVHTKENPYKCSECGKGFTQWGAMQRHVMAIHEKRKDVQCDECGKCFARKDYLKLHIQKCHWSKCDFCKESFEQPGELQQHLEVCTVPRNTPAKRRAPSDGKMYTARSGGQIRTPPMRTPPRKRARTTPAIRRRKLTTPARIDRNLMSIYDQFEDDPLADPDYQDTEEDEQQAPLEELVEEEGVQMDTEEVLEQEQVLQSIEELEKANGAEANDKVASEEEIIGDDGQDACADDTEACHDTANSDSVHCKDDSNVANSGEITPEPAVVEGGNQRMERENDTINKWSEEAGEEQQQHPTTGDTLESLVNALAAAAHCEGQQVQIEESKDQPTVNEGR